MEFKHRHHWQNQILWKELYIHKRYQIILRGVGCVKINTWTTDWKNTTSIAKKCMCSGLEILVLKYVMLIQYYFFKKSNKPIRYFPQTHGYNYFFLFCMKKDNKKMKHTIWKWKRIVSVSKYIHVHRLIFLYLAVSVHKVNYFKESVRACLFGANFV